MTQQTSTSKTIVALGEILWDVFPDRTCFGGAPANYACATAELCDARTNTLMVSGVGQDQLGKEALKQLNSHGVDVGWVQQNSFPTGQVDVSLDEGGSAAYLFKENVAWDNLIWEEELWTVAAKANAVCFGTLGQRSEESARVIQRFVKSTSAKCLRVFDINLRFPHVRDETIVPSLQLSDVLKLNDEELPYLVNLVNAEGDSPDEQLAWLRREFDLKLVAMTCGSQGVVLQSAQTRIASKPKPVDVVDTVGAGDAFTAVLTLRLLESLEMMNEDSKSSWDLESIANAANDAAAFVCTQPGATPAFPPPFKI